MKSTLACRTALSFIAMRQRNFLPVYGCGSFCQNTGYVARSFRPAKARFPATI